MRRLLLRVLSTLTLTLTLTLALAPWTAWSDALEGYAGLAESKALAVVPGSPELVGIAHSQANDLIAAMSALKTCESNRAPDHPACELRHLNGERITSGAEIRARVPEHPHPLFLWRVSVPDSTVYLAGSVHILKPSLYPLPAPYEQAFAAADKLVVEVNVAAQDPVALQQKTLRYASLQDGRRVDQLLPAVLLGRLTRSLERYGLTVSQVATVKPSYVMNQLVLLRLMTLGYQGEYGVEQHFLRRAGDREVLELETIDEQLALLFDQPMDLQLQLLEDTLDQEPGIEPLVAGMVSAWLSGDDQAFMEMFEAQGGESELSKQFMKQLLDHRNVGMAARIRGYLKAGGTYFVLVGAAHLIGEQGIIELLQREGIEPVRIVSTATIN